jgi:hypothetical protein
VRRRDFIRIVAGSVAGWPLAVEAQQRDRMPRVSVLIGIPENDPETKSRVRALRLGMRDAGWIEGSNIQIEYRYAADADAIKKHVAEVVRLPPDVILANSTPVMAALQPATKTVPIVFVIVNHPVGQGFVQNLKQPGGNITGFSFIEPEIVGKWINLLRDVKPDLSRSALMFNPTTAGYYDAYLRSYKGLPQQSKADLDAAYVRTEADVERVVAGLARECRSDHCSRSYHRRYARSDFEIGGTAPRPVDKPLQAVRPRGRPDVLWTGYGRYFPALKLIRGSHSQRRTCGQSACAISGQVRARCQSQNSQSSWSFDP